MDTPSQKLRVSQNGKTLPPTDKSYIFPKWSLAITWACILLLVGIASAAFAISFHALKDLAEAHGFPPSLAWLYPCVVDAGIATFSLAALMSEIQGRHTGWPLILVIAWTLLSVLLNIAHGLPEMIDGFWIQIVISGTAPLTLFLSFHLLLNRVRVAAEGSWPAPTTETSQSSRKGNESPDLTLANRSRLEKLEQRRSKVEKLTSQGMQPNEIARALDVHPRTIRRDLFEMRTTAPGASPNGDETGTNEHDETINQD